VGGGYDGMRCGVPGVAVAFARLPQRVRRHAVDRVELERDERYPGEHEVAQQYSGDGDHLELFLDDVAARGVGVATHRLLNAGDRYHLRATPHM